MVTLSSQRIEGSTEFVCVLPGVSIPLNGYDALLLMVVSYRYGSILSFPILPHPPRIFSRLIKGTSKNDSLFTFHPKAKEGKSVMDTRVVVDSGTYGIVRHPQVLGCILLMCGSILISQHWLSAIVAVPIFVLFYRYVLKEEENLIVKFGNDYKCYMQRVPSMNFMVGIIRLLKSRKHE